MVENQTDDHAFEKLIYDNQSLILRVCKIYCRSQSDIDDLFQDIVINLWKGLPSFKGNAKVSTWIYRVSLNTAISKARKSKKSKLIYPATLPDRVPNYQEESGDAALRIKALYAGIDRLKPVAKAIALLYLEEKSYDEIADTIGISAKNVSVKLVRLKRKLEKLIRPLIAMTE